MHIDQLPEEWKLFETVAGSHAYGTNTPESDVDVRGVFQMPIRDLVALNRVHDRAADESSDTEFHELEKFFHELVKCGPNVLELLWMPEDCVRLVTPKMQRIIDSRDLFISQKCFHSFQGYAHAQIKRAKGQNKWVNKGSRQQSGIKKLQDLLSTGAVSVDWLRSRFSEQVVEEVLNGRDLQ